jgi:hypothetical protein
MTKVSTFATDCPESIWREFVMEAVLLLVSERLASFKQTERDDFQLVLSTGETFAIKEAGITRVR